MRRIPIIGRLIAFAQVLTLKEPGRYTRPASYEKQAGTSWVDDKSNTPQL